MSSGGLHFDMYNVILVTILWGIWTKSAVLWYCIHSFKYLGLIVYYLYCKSLFYVLNVTYMCIKYHITLDLVHR